MADTLRGEASQRSGARSLLAALLVLGCIVVTLGIAEALLRIVDYAELHVPDDNAAYGYDAEIGWSLVPNSFMHATSGNRTISVQTNSLGLRERELEEPRPGTFLFIGDSFTFGYDAELNERFTNLLQQALPQYRMVNAGVSGYGTDQQYLTMQRLWNRVKPQVVVLTVCIDNDRDDNSSSFRWRHHKPYFARRPEGAWEVRGYPMPPSKRQLYTSSIWAEKSLLARFAIFAYWRIRHAETIVPDPTEHLINIVRWAAEARGARLVVGLQRREAKLEAHLQAQKIPYTTFEQARGYPTAGWHWTPEGNAVVATRYLALFADLGIASSLAPPAGDLADVDRIGRMLDHIEAAVDRDGLPVQPADAGDAFDQVRAAVHAMIADGNSRLSRIDSRLKQLGVPPPKDAPPEDAAIAEERARLSRELSELDAALPMTRLLAARADGLAVRIAGQRRAWHRHQLFERTASVLSPLTWVAAGRALPGELGGLSDYVRKWSIAVWDSGGVLRATIVLIASIVLGMAALVLLVRRERRRKVAKGELASSGKAISSFGVFLCLALTTPVVLIALTEALQVRMIEISLGLLAAVFVATFGHAAAAAVLAPDAPSRRLIAVEDATAAHLARHLVWGAQALAALVMTLAVHRALAAPPSLTVATNMLYALVIGGILFHLLLSTRGDRGRGAGQPGPIVPWLRGLGWLVLAVIAAALVAGYAAFAAFVAARLVSVVAVLGVLYLLLVLASELRMERAAADTPGGRSIGADIGVSASPIGRGVISLCIIVGLMLSAVLLMIGPW